jgi:hypothetical protein
MEHLPKKLHLVTKSLYMITWIVYIVLEQRSTCRERCIWYSKILFQKEAMQVASFKLAIIIFLQAASGDGMLLSDYLNTNTLVLERWNVTFKLPEYQYPSIGGNHRSSR